MKIKFLVKIHLKAVIISTIFAANCSQIAKAVDTVGAANDEAALQVPTSTVAQLAGDVPVEIYSRNQGGQIYKFYVLNQKLIAFYIDGDKGRQLPISGIPQALLGELTAEKVAKLQAMLEQCYFLVQRDAIVVNGRLKGGWGDDVHGGYSSIEFTTGGMVANYQRVTPGVEGSFKWAEDMGFTPKDAQVIADACKGVDYDPATKPESVNIKLGRLKGSKIPLKEALSYQQSWHFNMAWGDGADGTARDTRMVHAARCLWEAIRNADKNMLGKGLHPLQDSFAHTRDYVHNHFGDLGGVFLAFHLFNTKKGGADNPFGIKFPISPDLEDKINGLNERYTTTKIATYLYLLLYIAYAQDEQGRLQINDLQSFQQLPQVRIFAQKCQLPISRRWHGNLLGFLQAFSELRPPQKFLSRGRDARKEACLKYLSNLIKLMKVNNNGEDISAMQKQEIMEELEELKCSGPTEQILSNAKKQVAEVFKYHSITPIQFATYLEQQFIKSSSIITATPEELLDMRLLSFYALALLDEFDKIEFAQISKQDSDTLYRFYSKVGMFLNRVTQDWRSAERCLKKVQMINKEAFRDKFKAEFKAQVRLIDILTKLGDSDGRRGEIVKIFTDLGFVDVMAPITERGLPSAIRNLNPKDQSRILNTLGKWLGSIDKKEEALRVLQSALAINRRVGVELKRPDYIAATLANIADIESDLGHYPLVEQYRREIVELNKDVKMYKALGLYKLALVLIKQHKDLEALDNLMQAYLFYSQSVGLKSSKTERVVSDAIERYQFLNYNRSEIDGEIKHKLFGILSDFYKNVIVEKRWSGESEREQKLRLALEECLVGLGAATSTVPAAATAEPTASKTERHPGLVLSREQEARKDEFLKNISRRYILAMRNADASKGEVLWGGDLELIAIANIYNLRITVCRPSGVMGFELQHPIGPVMGRPIRLWYTGNHYENCDFGGNHTNDVPIDGNCLFHAVLRALHDLEAPFGSSYKFNINAVAALRNRVADAMLFGLSESGRVSDRNADPIYARYAAIFEAQNEEQLHNAIVTLPQDYLLREALRILRGESLELQQNSSKTSAGGGTVLGMPLGSELTGGRVSNLHLWV